MSRETIDDVLEHIFKSSSNTKEQGTAFENSIVFFPKNDPLYAQKFSGMWLWSDAPTCIGIDVVAPDAQDNSYWAIQCKCYQGDAQLNYKQVSTTFSTAAADGRYDHYAVVDTVNSWSPMFKKIASQYKTVRIEVSDMRESDLDRTPFLDGRAPSGRNHFDPRYIVGLVERVVGVSMETLEVVQPTVPE